MRAVAQSPMLPRLLSAYRQIVTHRDVVSHLLVNGLGFGWMFAYVAGSPLVLIEHQACRADRLRHAVRLHRRRHCGRRHAERAVGEARRRLAAYAASAILLAVFATLALVGLTATGWTPLPVLMPLLVLSTAMFWPCRAQRLARRPGPIPELAGIAGGLLTSVQMLCGAVASWAVAFYLPRHSERSR